MMAGIFTGKKEKYNRLILQSLFYSKKTTQQIAEFIFDNDSETKERGVILGTSGA